MGLNGAIPTPQGSHGEFTLESLGLETQDHLNKDGVLGYQEPNAPDAVIHQPAPGAEGTTSLNQNEIEQLPDWNTKLVSIQDGVKKVTDLVSIQKDIEGTDQMDGTKAMALNATLESLGSERFSPTTFTSFASRTGVDVAKRTIDRVIQSTNEALLTQFREAQPDIVAGLITHADVAKEYCIYDMRDCIAEAVRKIDAIRPDLKAGPVMLPFSDDEFLDMMDTNLMCVDMDKLKSGVPVSSDFRVAFSTMKEIWSKCSSVRKICTELATMNRHSDDGEYRAAIDELHVKTLSHVFKENAAAAVAEMSTDAIAAATDGVEEGFQALPVDALPSAGTTDLIASASKELMERAERLDYAKSDLETFAKFACAVTTVLLGLTSLR